MKFRKNCQLSEDFFRTITTDAEKNLTGNSEDGQEASGSQDVIKNLKVEEDTAIDLQAIKDEPFDDFDLEGINNILENRSKDSAYLSRTKKEESSSGSSDSEMEYGEVNKKSNNKRSAELQDFDVW